MVGVASKGLSKPQLFCGIGEARLRRIDLVEDGPLFHGAEAAPIAACFEAADAVAKVSSIHVNEWFGCHDKLAPAAQALSKWPTQSCKPGRINAAPA